MGVVLVFLLFWVVHTLCHVLVICMSWAQHHSLYRVR